MSALSVESRVPSTNLRKHCAGRRSAAIVADEVAQAALVGVAVAKYNEAREALKEPWAGGVDSRVETDGTDSDAACKSRHDKAEGRHGGYFSQHSTVDEILER